MASRAYKTIVRILVELRHSFIVLNRDRAAKIVELLDLLVAIVVSEGILVMRIADIQRSARGTSVIFFDSNNTVRLTAAGGIVCIRKFVSIRIGRLRQEVVAGIGKA